MTGAAAQDPRFTYFDSYNPHLTLPPSLQARFKDSKYAVIKGTTMFIYENEHMSECLGIITLPHYQVSVPGNQKDSHIYSKRNPIWLKYQPNPNHTRHSTASSDSNPLSSKDYYLSMVNSVDKEDLYFTLLRCSKLKLHSQSCLREIPKRDSTLFDKSAMNTLIRTIHSNEHQFQAAWLNAVLGRIFLGVYKTPQVKDMVFQKLVDKLTRVRLPNFLNDIRMKSVHLGDGVPMITRPKLLTLKPNGDLIMDMSLLYQGGFRAEVEAEAIVTVTKKIQPIKVSLVLAITLIRLEGRMQVWIKPPPCNRLWYGFYQKPQVEMKIEPVVSDKHIKSNLIIKAIENKMLEAIAETMVLPNMDDVPFSDSEGVGGIFDHMSL
ncbi:putative integral membrane protein conserved region-domain-containing protein [Lobosporangium transversale]|uniref:Putative integral membrane protein conserved region-domain-containing protein n=1 Tax=Lobosporangium transversale TaxID=64571 RepID=A0A1Y2GDT2_9FUNG|nr:putative integral membrane protein conserved region-domain-containing protein [Lobosporangium transversale]ORZ08022.1 putative integral membrane protein conserved region-domain-containing protein [Lobosporangium transversale]|eukprot:XP_021878256.1 putative integral membrane protein conserved region-domain-containing protein [Lobosporangium transversale]